MSIPAKLFPIKKKGPKNFSVKGKKKNFRKFQGHNKVWRKVQRKKLGLLKVKRKKLGLRKVKRKKLGLRKKKSFRNFKGKKRVLQLGKHLRAICVNRPSYKPKFFNQIRLKKRMALMLQSPVKGPQTVYAATLVNLRKNPKVIKKLVQIKERLLYTKKRVNLSAQLKKAKRHRVLWLLKKAKQYKT